MANYQLSPTHHWNYFLALERELEQVARYIEFSEGNFKVYSVELTRLLLTSCSEIDVMAKLLCELLTPNKPRNNMNDYRNAINERFSGFNQEQVFIDRYALVFKPWEPWSNDNNPSWWGSHNKVKHQRSEYYQEATLENVLNAMGGLLVCMFYYYQYKLADSIENPLLPKDTFHKLNQDTILINLKADYYHQLFVG